MSMDDRAPGCPPSAEDAWATLQTLHECVVRSLARGDEYDLLLRASRDAEALLARHAADYPLVTKQHGHVADAPWGKAA